MFSIHVDVLLVPQVARAGRFGTKGLAVTFVSDEADAKTLNEVQDRFEVNVAELPEEIDISSYSKLPHAWSVKWVAFKSLLFCQNDNQGKTWGSLSCQRTLFHMRYGPANPKVTDCGRDWPGLGPVGFLFFLVKCPSVIQKISGAGLPEIFHVLT